LCIVSTDYRIFPDLFVMIFAAQGLCGVVRKETLETARTFSTYLAKQGVSIVYEDNHLVVAVKPSGLLSQPNKLGWTDNNIYDLLKEHYRILRGKSSTDSVYLGLLHRLDKETSGLILFAKTSKAAARLSQQIRRKTNKTVTEINSSSSKNGNSSEDSDEGATIQKRYYAMVHGRLTGGSTVSNLLDVCTDSTIKRQMASLRYDTISNHKVGREDWSLLKVDIFTGRKHQIRAQLSHLGHPIVGDRLYGQRDSLKSGLTSPVLSQFPGMGLHAYELSFEHPVLTTMLVGPGDNSIYSDIIGKTASNTDMNTHYQSTIADKKQSVSIQRHFCDEHDLKPSATMQRRERLTITADMPHEWKWFLR
jgi:23S rRNA pseudouridine1911/1915/1917 synthase